MRKFPVQLEPLRCKGHELLFPPFNPVDFKSHSPHWTGLDRATRMSMPMLKKCGIGTLVVTLVLLVVVSLLDPDTILEFRPRVQLHSSTVGNLQQRVKFEPEGSGAPHLDNKKFNDFMRSQREKQEERRQTLAKGCEKYRKNAPSTYDVVTNPLWNIIVDHEHRLLFCFVPKVACTSWKRVFLVVKGVINNTDDISQFDVNHRLQKKLDFFHKQPRSRREHILKHYTKFLIARDPFSRVLSAYKNKLAPDSTLKGARRWQSELGQTIIEYFHGKSGKSFDKTTYDLTFEDFVRFLVAEEPLQKQDNRHWMEIQRMCLPCVINYDVVGKFETMSTDAEFIMRTSGLSDRVSFPSSAGSSPTNSSQQLQRYYSHLPEDLVRSLYERYRLDFELFGYEPHDFNAGVRIS